MRWSREEWIQIVEQFERSSQLHVALCSQHRLNAGSFRDGLYRLRSGPERGKVAPGATRLLAVRVATAGAVDNETVIELTVGDAMLRLRGGFGSAYVAVLVKLVRDRC